MMTCRHFKIVYDDVFDDAVLEDLEIPLKFCHHFSHFCFRLIRFECNHEHVVLIFVKLSTSKPSEVSQRLQKGFGAVGAEETQTRCFGNNKQASSRTATFPWRQTGGREGGQYRQYLLQLGSGGGDR